MLRVLRWQAAHDHVPDTGDGAGDGQVGRWHVCRSTRLPEPADPRGSLFPSVHGTGIIRTTAMSEDAVYEMVRPRVEQAGYTTTQIQQMGGHSLRAGFAPRRSGPAPTLETYAREHAPLVGDAVT